MQEVVEESEEAKRDFAPAPHHDVSFAPLTAFRAAEKKYKLFRLDRRQAKRARVPETDFSDVVDVGNLEANSPGIRALIASCGDGCFSVASVPGLTVIPGAIDERTQREWARRAVFDFSRSAVFPNNNITTLDPTAQTEAYVAPLRWVTLGVRYDWTAKTYAATDDKPAPFPIALRDLTAALVARAVPRYRQQQPEAAAAAASFEGQTAIVNFYPPAASMCAHQDVSESCLEKPLVSVSLGRSCVFLMGGQHRDDPPTAIFLRSGDVAIFDGPSRTAFHAVPRILDDLPAHFLSEASLAECEAAGKSGDAFAAAMSALRININIRQVVDQPCPWLFAHC